MRCRFKHKIFQNEENGYTIAIFTTQDTSVPLSARDKYLASRNIIGFSAIGFGLPLTDEIELEMEGRWESGEHGTQYQVENFMEVVPRTKEGILGYLSSGAVKGIGPKMADTIFRKFGLQTLEIMENNPQETYCGKEIKTKVLKGVDLSISKGEFVCIFGESGSGKSTLLNILGLLDDATIGTYKLDGVDIRKLSKKESAFIRNQKIGFVFQAYHLIPELNALENLVVPLGYAGMRKKEREKIAYELLTEFGIDDLEKKHVSQMSGGEQQRIAIMRAIINKPQILLADEPTGNLDKENSQTIMNLFERLNKQGMTIVMVTHDTSLAKYGTRVVRVEDGRIIEKGKEILK